MSEKPEFISGTLREDHERPLIALGSTVNSTASVHLDVVRDGLQAVQAQILNLQNVLDAAQSFAQGQAAPPPPQSQASDLEGMSALLEKRELQLMVLMSRYLGLAHPVYGETQSLAKDYLRHREIDAFWPENNQIFVDLLFEYAARAAKLRRDGARGRPKATSLSEYAARAAELRRDGTCARSKATSLSGQGTPDGAARFSAEVHAGMLYGGRPYTVHTTAVAELVSSYFPDDEALISAAHLHDAVEDAPDKSSAEKIEKQIELRFGEDVIELVMAVTNEPGDSRAERLRLTYPKIARAGWRAVALKLADRISNLIDPGCSDSYREMYASEYRSFRISLRGVGLGVEQLQRMWSQLDDIMISHGVQIPLLDRPAPRRT